MSLDSLKSGVSDYKEKKTEVNRQKDELQIEIEKADELMVDSLRVDEEIKTAFKDVRRSFDVQEDEISDREDQLTDEKRKLQDTIKSEQGKLNAVQKKIDSVAGKKYTGGLDAVSQKCDDMLAELDSMLADLNNGEVAGNGKDSAVKTGSIVKISGDSYRVDDNGDIHMKKTDDGEYHVLPNTKYVVNGYTYQSDEYGRIIHVEGKIKVKDGSRSALNVKVSDMQDNDQRGHVIADLLGGSNLNDNLVAQLGSVNQGSYKILEKNLASLTELGNLVYGDYSIEYKDNSKRPSAITVDYSVNNGEPISQIDVFAGLGIQDVDAYSDFESNLIRLNEQGHQVDCNYSVVFSNDHNHCWVFVEYMLDGKPPMITSQFI